VPVEAIPVFHGELPVTAFRIGAFAYVTDVSSVPDESLARLKQLDLLILGALRAAPPHPTHFTIGQALEVVEQLRPRQTFFTHLTHDVPHRATEAALPPGVRLAYDGLILDVAGENRLIDP
jgi:phosphoribosyl 1,2-cyclic phosphate phosphodiesterase